MKKLVSLAPLSEHAIVSKITAKQDKYGNVGYCDITYISAQAPFGTGECYRIIRRNGRLINHNKTKLFKLEESIRNADNSKKLLKCWDQFNALDEAHQIRVGKNVKEILMAKKAAIDAGEEIGITPKKTITAATKAARSNPGPFLTANANGTVTLMMHDSFRKVFVKGAFRTLDYKKPEVAYYFKAADGTISEITDEATLKDVIRVLDVAKPPKSGSSNPSQVRSLHIEDILDID